MIYLDNAATTAPDREAVEAALKFLETDFYNPSALYRGGFSAHRAVEEARKNILSLIAPQGGYELVFTSSGSEADVQAVLSSVRRGNMVTTEGEHAAVYNTAKELAKRGTEVRFAKLNADGSVNEEDLLSKTDAQTALVSVIHVNNETGAINDIGRLASCVKKAAPAALFHSDGVQAFGKIKVDLRALGVDLYTLSAHKIHGPKGIGALYVAKGASVHPLVYGGGQEKGFRSGTENGPAVEAFAAAAERTAKTFDTINAKKRAYTLELKRALLASGMDIAVITDTEKSAPHILTVAFGGVRGEVLLHALEKRGILVGVGSACSSHRESRFKTLLGLDERHRDGIVRFSVSEFNEEDEVPIVAEACAEEVKKLVEYARK